MKKVIIALIIVILTATVLTITVIQQTQQQTTETVITEKKEILAGDTVFYIQVHAQRQLVIVELTVDKLIFISGRTLYSIDGRIYYGEQLFATYEIAESHLDEYREKYIKYI